MVYKRGNNQPSLFAAMNLGQWYHLALRFDGNTTGNNTMAFLNGNQVTFAAINGWSNCTATTVFEMGRMDAFDTSTLDELALVAPDPRGRASRLEAPADPVHARAHRHAEHARAGRCVRRALADAILPGGDDASRSERATRDQAVRILDQAPGLRRHVALSGRVRPN